MKNKITKTESKHWFKEFWLTKLIWTDSPEIEKYAKNYDSIKWYKSPRYWILLWAIAAVIFGSFIMHNHSNADATISAIFSIVVFVSFAPFIIKGYLFPFILLIIYKSVDAAFMIGQNSHLFLSIFIFWAIWVGICIACIRIEILRNKIYKVKRRFWKDFLYSITIFIVGLLITITSFFVMDNENISRISTDNFYSECYGTMLSHVKTSEDKMKMTKFCACFADFMSKNITSENSSELAVQNCQNNWIVQ